MEREATSTITSKNQTTVPKIVRQTLQLNPGDKIAYVIYPKGDVHISKIKESNDMWTKAYHQEKKYGSFSTPEPDWGADVESEDFD